MNFNDDHRQAVVRLVTVDIGMLLQLMVIELLRKKCHCMAVHSDWPQRLSKDTQRCFVSLGGPPTLSERRKHGDGNYNEKC